ncbi:hypothetical protein JNUCC0626_47325 [Lentzea sp. JNUCC 0626]|uniref:hypothetical protein n=1 Tax=Lentzea sp. JNUCC 0626 TaxID=3367513 RepID=UPI003748DBDB
MGRITPIKTRYAGYRFRSRREARWAVFFDTLGIPWRYEPEGFSLGDAGAYLPDFQLYPNTELAMWFEVKGEFPTDVEVRKAQALSTGTGLRTCIYFGEVDLPAPASLTNMSLNEFVDHVPEYRWVDDIGWAPFLTGPAKWELGFGPTAYMIIPQEGAEPGTSPWWWTDCGLCGRIILKVHGQIGWCPYRGDDLPKDHLLYPSFGHATPRLQAAYTAGKSAQFEFGETGHSS